MSDVLSPETEVGRKMTLEEWMDLPEDVPGELVDGHLVEEEMPTGIHEAVVAWLIGVLTSWVLPRGGVVLASDAKFAVRADRGRKPDVTVYLPGAPRPDWSDSVLRVPPTLAVEVVSPRPRDTRRDRVEKLDEYAEFGIRVYWILDPTARTLEVFELEESGRYSRALGASQGKLGSLPGCAGLDLDLDDLWALVDRLATDDEELPAT